MKFYAVPGVAQACIDLQDQAGVDVNILFFLLWNATQSRALDNAEVAELERDIGAWRDMAVVPLRNVRRALKIAAAGDGAATRRKASAPASRPSSSKPNGCSRRRCTASRNPAGSASQAPSKIEAARASVEAYQAVLRPFPAEARSTPC